MIQECKFDKNRDIQETVPDMFIDLTEAIHTGVVIDTGTIGEPNDIEHPNNIRGRVEDAFTAIEAQRQIIRNAKAGPVPAPATAPAPAEGPKVNPSKG